MTCRAILHIDGKEHIPALRVRLGELSAKQCDHEYKGLEGDCPTCKAQKESADLSDGGSYAAAMAPKDPVVRYRRASYGPGGIEPYRLFHFGHFPGYWGDGLPGDCSRQDRETHRVNLLTIKKWYEERFPGCSVKLEEHLRRPGDPPRPYCPDLAIYDDNGKRIIAVEYQRSYESFDSFQDRDTLRRSEHWVKVDWWFDDTHTDSGKARNTVYEKSQMHRTWLSYLGQEIYRCWVDPQTYIMQADYGHCGDLPPSRCRRIEKHIERADLKECSIANAIRILEGQPEEAIIKHYKEPLRARVSDSVNFREDFNYSVERQRRLALAVMQRQQRLDEQDRRHREHDTKLRLTVEIREVVYQAREQNFRLETKASITWVVNALLEELKRVRLELDLCLSQKAEEVRAEEHRRRRLDLAIKPIRAAIALAKARDEQADAELRRVQILLPKIIGDVEAYKRYAAQKAEEALWRPIEVVNIGRSRTMVLNLYTGDLIRQRSGVEPEVYQGRTGAGYSTNRFTHTSIDGWEVRRESQRHKTAA